MSRAPLRRWSQAAYLVLGWFVLLACLMMFGCAAALVAGCRTVLPS